MTPMALILILAASLPTPQEIAIEHLGGRGVRGLVPFSSKPQGQLRVAVGGGVAALASEPAALSEEILGAAGFDAVALGGDELEAAKTRLDKLPFVCANVLDAASGKPVVRSHVVVKRVALIGVTAQARGGKVPDGWRIEDPAKALRDLLPAVAAEADAIIVLAVMDRLDAAALLKAAGRPCVVLVPARGLNDPIALNVGEGWIAQSPDGERVAGRLSISAASGKITSAKNEFVTVPVPPKEMDRLKALAAKHGVSTAKFITERKPAGGVEEGPAASFEPGKPRAVWVGAANRALDVRIHSFLVTPEFAGRKAEEGRAWLVVDSEWTNEIPMKFVFDRETPVGFQIGDFNEILFVVVNGSRLARLDTELTSGPGGLTEAEFMLPYVGSTRRGLSVFNVPAAGIESLDLRFYDFTHGHIAVPMLAKKEAADPKPIAAAKNEILEASVWSVRKDKTGAPEGMTFVRIELRARSVWPFEVDATAFDLKARKGQKMKVPSLGRWEDIRGRATLVADGDQSLAASDTSPLADSTLLLPDPATGGELLFLAPETVRPLELRLQFEKIGVPGRSEPVQPKALSLRLEPK